MTKKAKAEKVEKQEQAVTDTLPDAAGNRKRLTVGTVIESTKEGAKTPLVVFAEIETVMGKTSLVEYRVAGKDRVALTHPYTAFQLERFGYRWTGVSTKFDPKTITFGKGVEIELVPVQEPRQKGYDFKAVKEPAKATTKAEAPKPEPVKGSVDKTPPAKPQEAGRGDGGEDVTAAELLGEWVWGIPAPNMAELEAKLKKMGISPMAVADEIDEVIARHAKVAK